jgi:NADH:ubiquinone reductase (H+-translocating)
VVIVGAGFAGLATARALERAPVDVLMVDRANYHTFQPLLYQVATAGLDAENIGRAVRGIFQKQSNFDFRQAEVDGVDWGTRTLLTDGPPVPFDVLVVAAGATTDTFDVEGVAEHGLFLKTLWDALALRSHVLRQFERAAADPRVIDEGALTVVIVGGGATGVELAGAFVELFGHALTKDFRHHEVPRAKVVLVEATDHLLDAFGPAARHHALRTLQARGVDVRVGAVVDRVTPTSVHLRDGTVIPAGTLVWAAGVRASPVADALALPQERTGRIVVDDTLRVAAHRDVYVVGDIAAFRLKDGSLLPQVAPVAVQQGHHAAAQIQRAFAGQPARPFRYRERGSMATVGRHAAVVELPFGVRCTGSVAWLMWLILHLVTLMGFRNRVSVFLSWAWNYATFDRGSRLIVDPSEPWTSS